MHHILSLKEHTFAIYSFFLVKNMAIGKENKLHNWYNVLIVVKSTVISKVKLLPFDFFDECKQFLATKYLFRYQIDMYVVWLGLFLISGQKISSGGLQEECLLSICEFLDMVFSNTLKIESENNYWEEIWFLFPA